MENDHIEPTIESLVAEFNTLGEMLSEHHVLRCKPVARAKAKGKNGFEEFCAKAKLRPESSTTRKYLKIGLEADWLLPMAHQLPAEWTTIYDVAVLGQAKAEEMVRLGTLHPQVTARELKAAASSDVSDDIVSDTSEADETIGTTEPCVFQVDASDLPDQERLKLYRDLEQKAAEYGLTVAGLPHDLAERLIIDCEAA
jgi:hypothetical protein